MIPKLEVSHLCYSYHTMEGETEALSDLSFQVQTGEFLAVVGPWPSGPVKAWQRSWIPIW